MASSILNHTLRSLRTSGLARSAQPARYIHVSPVVRKKKQRFSKEQYVASFEQSEDAFADIPAETQPTPVQESVIPASSSSTSPSTEAVTPTRVSAKLSPEARQERFDSLYEFVEKRMGPKPAVKTPQVRNSAWIHLFGLATTSEQLEKVTELFPRWRDSRREFTDLHAEMFVRRCEELGCPLLALKVFGDLSKYGVNLSLPAARHLLRSIHLNHPIENTISAVALYSVYNLPSVSNDLVSCSMLVLACMKHNTDASNLVVKEMLPHLKRMLRKEGKNKVQGVSAEDKTTKITDRSSVWSKWSLVKIKELLEGDSSPNAVWVKNWVENSWDAHELAAR